MAGSRDRFAELEDAIRVIVLRDVVATDPTAFVNVSFRKKSGFDTPVANAPSTNDAYILRTSRRKGSRVFAIASSRTKRCHSPHPATRGNRSWCRYRTNRVPPVCARRLRPRDEHPDFNIYTSKKCLGSVSTRNALWMPWLREQIERRQQYLNVYGTARRYEFMCSSTKRETKCSRAA